MTTRHECPGRVADRELRGMIYSCQRNATVERNGQWYCWQHDPERMEANREKRMATWDAKQDRRSAMYACRARNARLAQLVTLELAALLEQLAQNTEILINSDDSPNSLPVRKWRREVKRGYALAARIREALALEVNNVKGSYGNT